MGQGTTSTTVMLLAVFGASAVEMVEALTLVVAAGVSRGWRSALEGAATAVVVLVVLVAVLGAPLVHDVPIDTLRVVVGALLLVLGLGWLRKAILRAAGLEATHDEDAIFERQVAALRTGARATGRRDGVGFTVAFKGVLLEGLEVVLIVVSLGSSDHRLGPAAAAAGLALVLVGIAGAIVARQLSGVPENAIKMVVGTMLTSFGVFWVGEGAGVHWPGSDAMVLALMGATGLVAWATITWARVPVPPEAAPGGFPAPGGP